MDSEDLDSWNPIPPGARPAPGSLRAMLSPLPRQFYDMNEPPPVKSLWLGWIGATTLGLALATAAGWLIIGSMLFASVNVAHTPVMLLAGGVMGAIFGLVTWLALREYLPEPARRRWLGANMLAGLTIALLSQTNLFTLAANSLATTAPLLYTGYYSSLILYGGAGALCGAILGIAQTAVLGEYLRDTGWWVPGCLVGGALAGGLAMLLFFPAMLLFYVTLYFCLGIPAALFFGASLGLLLALPSGGVFARMIRDYPPPRTPPSSSDTTTRLLPSDF